MGVKIVCERIEEKNSKIWKMFFVLVGNECDNKLAPSMAAQWKRFVEKFDDVSEM